jgi:archaeosine synthase
VKDYSIILSVGKCSWGKCVFCGWGKLDFGQKTLEELQEQFFRQYKKINKEEPFRIKFYVSGSFFDNQVPEEFFNWLVDFLKEEKEKNDNLKAVLFETKIIDLLNKKRVEKFIELNKSGIETWVGIGFEGVNNEELRALKKDFQSVEQFLNITKQIKEKYPVKFRVYFLINPPLEGEYYLSLPDLKVNEYYKTWTYNKNKPIIKREVERLKRILELTKNNFEEVVLINTYPHKNAEIFNLFYEKKWRPLTKNEFEEIFKEVFKEFKEVYFIGNTKYEVDFSNYSFVPQFPTSLKKEYKEKIRGAKLDNLVNRVYEIWEEYLLYFYRPKKEKKFYFYYLVLLENLIICLKHID